MTFIILQIAVLISIFLGEANGMPVQPNKSLRQAINYLTKYGYLKEKKTQSTGGVTLHNNDKIRAGLPGNYLSEVNSLLDQFFTDERTEKTLAGFSQDEIKRALFKLQSFSQIKLTGQLDSDTKQILETPRCGVKDMNVHRDQIMTQIAKNMRVKLHKRFRRFVQQGSKWSKSIIKWSIPSKRWSKKMTKSVVKSTLTSAFRVWAEVIPLVFRWESNPALADITVLFAQGYHGDTSPFDGRGNELAHAFFPQYGGDIHFDDAEPWTATTSDKNHKSLLKVAIHEIGHSLGLDHTSVSGSIMNPVYSSLAAALGDDDMKGAQAIYGLCDPLRISSIESCMFNGRTYIFKDNNYWKYDDTNDRVTVGYPQPSSKWYGIPNDIDEIFVWGHNWRTYFFKGAYYYRYNEYLDKVDPGYPRLISSGWPGVPTDIDAALTVDSVTSYFFKGSLCYKFDNRLDRVAPGYPRSIDLDWPGAPKNMDTAFQWMHNSVFYFFKDEYYWQWNPKKKYTNGAYRIRDGWKNICNV